MYNHSLSDFHPVKYDLQVFNCHNKIIKLRRMKGDCCNETEKTQTENERETEMQTTEAKQ